MKRKIIKIDENKCVGCGNCTTGCHQGALKVINGKAKLVNDQFCDGLGRCIKTCPTGALTIEEREAQEFKQEPKPLACGCPGTMQKELAGHSTELKNWPIQLKLINPNASYLQDTELVIAADCTAFAYNNFHGKFLKGKVLIMFCPKLDSDTEEYVEKLADIFRHKNIRSVSIVHMEVPCCGGVEAIITKALQQSGKNVILKDYTVSLTGELV